MTVSNTSARTSAVGTGAEQTVPFSFPISDNSDITVIQRVIATGEETTLAETTNYTVVNNGDDGGSITTVSPYVASTAQIHIIRETEGTQTLDLVQGGSFNAENVEDALDKNTRLINENADLIGRVLRFPDADPATAVTPIDNSIDRKGNYLFFDSSTGAPTVAITTDATSIVTTPFTKTLLEAGSEKIARTTLLAMDVFNVKDAAYGALGNGSANDTVALQTATDAAKATTNGGIVYFPPGVYILTDNPIRYNPDGSDEVASGIVESQVQFIGHGRQSKIIQTTANVHVFDIGSADRTTNAFRMSNLWISMPSGTGSGIYMQRVMRGVIRDIWMPRTGKAGIEMSQVQSMLFSGVMITENIGRDSINGAGGIGDYGFFIEDQATLGVSNANVFSGCVAEGASTGDWYCQDQNNDGGTNVILGGTYEGGDTYEIYAKNCNGLKILGVHVETKDVVLDGCVSSEVNLTNGNVQLLSNIATKVSGNIHKLLIDAGCENCINAAAGYPLNQDYRDYSDTTLTETTGRINQNANTVKGIVSKNVPLLWNGDFDQWDTQNQPTQFTAHLFTDTTNIQQETTNIKHGDFSVKITKESNGTQSEGIKFRVPTAYVGQWISIEAWMKPATTATRLSLGVVDNGGTTSSRVSFTTQTTGWQRMTGSFLYGADDTTFDVVLGHFDGNATGLIVYVDSVNIWAQIPVQGNNLTEFDDTTLVYENELLFYENELLVI